MSFVDTKDAAATCVLSTRWRNLFSWWKDFRWRIPVLHLNINGPPDPVLALDDSDGEFSESLSIGYKVILQRNRSPIRKLSVCAEDRLVERFQMALEFFISAALQFDVQELDIVVSHSATGRLFPIEIFICKTLVTVKLSWQVNLLVPSSVFLPNLKVLHLTGPVGLIDENYFPRLIRGCPSLEELLDLPVVLGGKLINFISMLLNLLGRMQVVKPLFLSENILKDIVRSFILDITSCSHASSLLFAAVGHFCIQALVLEASDYDIADIL
ncbi:F-box protein At4g22280-like [Coffea arabica]|uniref:F-box protein At4g22280-like n=1 Tax=Coffea arabica TaxID=13443 RepID=A0ABM4UEY5_COFAR